MNYKETDSLHCNFDIILLLGMKGMNSKLGRKDLIFESMRYYVEVLSRVKSFGHVEVFHNLLDRSTSCDQILLPNGYILITKLALHIHHDYLSALYVFLDTGDHFNLT
jgi:hypothetical protein